MTISSLRINLILVLAIPRGRDMWRHCPRAVRILNNDVNNFPRNLNTLHFGHVFQLDLSISRERLKIQWQSWYLSGVEFYALSNEHVQKGVRWLVPEKKRIFQAFRLHPSVYTSNVNISWTAEDRHKYGLEFFVLDKILFRMIPISSL